MRIFLMLFVFFIGISLNVSAGTFNKELLPELYSPTNAGTEFVVNFIPAYYAYTDSYNKVRLYLTSTNSAKVRITIQKTNIDTTIFIKPNEVTEYSIEPKLILPYNPVAKTANEGVYPKCAMIVKSDSPVICYAQIRFQDYCEGFLALPVSSWSGEYNISTYNDFTNNITEFSASTAVIIGAFDNTRVTFTLGGNSTTQIKLANKDSLLPEEDYTRIINRGDVWVIPGYGANNDLTGSTIRSNKPVGVVSGNYCAQVPVNLTPCEYLIEQEIPVYSFSKRYYVTPVKNRKTGSMVKVSAVSPETEVKVNGITKGTIQNYYGKEGTGFLSFRINTDNKPAVISSDSRINVVQYNTGKESNQDEGVPFKMQVLSSDHFSKIIGFSTPSVKATEFYTFNYINIIFKPDEQGNIPPDLILEEYKGGTVISKSVKDLATSNPIPFPEAETDGTFYNCITLNIPPSGKYILKSPTPVGAMIYGFTKKESYGFPAHIYLKNHQKSQDSLHPSVIVTKLAEGDYAGDISDEPFNLNSVRSNLGMVHLIGDSSYNYELLNDGFISGTDPQTSFEVRPIKISENASAYLRISDYVGNDTVLKFYYSSTPLKPTIKLKNFEDKNLCPQKNYIIEFDSENGEFQSGNIFKLKLGRLKTGFPITIGESGGTLIRKIEFTVPDNLSSGDDYFLYIESGTPIVRSDTILNIKINILPNVTIQGITNVAINNIYKYTVQNTALDFKWSALNGEIIGADNLPTVKIKWNTKGNGKVFLNYSFEGFCSTEKELVTIIGDDFVNAIEGPDLVCKNDLMLYNSFLNTGFFDWTVEGGILTGASNEYVINIKWNKAGTGSLKLVYTNPEGFSKELEYTVTIKELPPTPLISRNENILTSSAISGNQWFLNGAKINGAITKSYDANNQEGIYTVQVTSDGCLSEFSDPYNYKETSVAVIYEDDFVKIYPNPVNDNLNIRFNSNDNYNVRISILNIQMQEVDVISNENSFDSTENITYSASKLSSGIYFVRINSGIISRYYKLMVVK